jgi:hypothetical protein
VITQLAGDRSWWQPHGAGAVRGGKLLVARVFDRSSQVWGF